MHDSANIIVESHSADLPELRSRLAREGCFAPAKLHYVLRVSAIGGALVLAFVGLLSEPTWPPRVGLLLIAAFACVQAAFVAHDVGDGALSASRSTSESLRQLLLTFACGTSSTYFHHLHRLHHLSLDRQSKPNGRRRYLKNRYELAWLKRLLSWDGRVFMVGTILLRGLTFRLESIRFVFANPSSTRFDAVTLAAHYLTWFGVPALVIGSGAAVVNLALVTLLAGGYVGTMLVLNHEGMSKVDEVANLAPLTRVLATTRNLSGSWLASFLLGGINSHIEHHLFPDMPASHLPKARGIVRDFCKQRGLPYVEVPLASAVLSALWHFRTVGRDRLVAEALS